MGRLEAAKISTDGSAKTGHAATPPRGKEQALERAIGREVHSLRRQHGMTVTELAALASLSPGMLSKIENGLTSPSLSTLQGLANALNVPVTALLRRHEQRHEATFVPAGEGLHIKRRGTRAGHDYQLLGQTVGKRMGVEPYHITLTEESEVYPAFQHEGTEFIHLVEGSMVYRHGSEIFEMGPGDSLFFDAEASHGPEKLIETPVRFICVIAYEATDANDAYTD